MPFNIHLHEELDFDKSEFDRRTSGSNDEHLPVDVLALRVCRSRGTRANSYEESGYSALHRPNENKISDGWRGGASLRVEGGISWKGGAEAASRALHRLVRWLGEKGSCHYSVGYDFLAEVSEVRASSSSIFRCASLILDS